MSPKFIIMCWPRSGSTLLDEALRSHPELSCGGELFNTSLHGSAEHVQWSDQAFDSLYPFGKTEVMSKRKWREDKFSLVPYAKLIFDKYNGFKFIYDHLTITSPVMDYFESLDLKLIFLRRNLLDSVFSFSQAMKTDVWQRRNGEPVVVPERMRLRTEDVERFIEAFDQEHLYRERFCDHKQMLITHGDLVCQWDRTMSEVLLFLGVTNCRLPQSTLKRIKGHARDYIENYDEIIQCFSKTKYAHHFMARAF